MYDTLGTACWQQDASGVDMTKDFTAQYMNGGIGRLQRFNEVMARHVVNNLLSKLPFGCCYWPGTNRPVFTYPLVWCCI